MDQDENQDGHSSLATVVRERIKALRKRRGMTQEQLCERAGISVDAVTRIESGSRAPTLATLERIASALDVRVVDLVRTGRLPAREASEPVQRIVALLEGAPQTTQNVAEAVVRALVRALPED